MLDEETAVWNALVARLARIELAIMFIADHGVPAGEGWADRVRAILDGEGDGGYGDA